MILEISALSKAWEEVAILEDLSLSLEKGQHTLIVGPSGSGKSTLLHIIARLVSPDSGRIRVDGRALSELGDAARFRRERIGLIFQDVHLLEGLTVRQNIELLQVMSSRQGVPLGELLGLLELTPLADRRVHGLSRGERQRVALARAFACTPALILADEPTASLDPSSRERCLSQLFALSERTAATVLLVSHDAEVTGRPELKQRKVLSERRLAPLE